MNDNHIIKQDNISKLNLISNELRDRMTDTSNNWKIRTETIDEILIII